MGAPLKSQPKRICQNCGKEFIAISYHQKFCSKKCTYQYHNKHRNLKPNVEYVCVICGKQVVKYLEPSKQKISAMKYCSRKCKGVGLSGEKHPMWSGGRCINDQGYIEIHCPGHPAASNRGYVKEQRLIMEKYLGRYLTKEEVVHHLNEDPADNRIENLMLFPNQAEHKKYHENGRTRNDLGQYERKGNDTS